VVNLSRKPELTLAAIPDSCETATVIPQPSYELFGLQNANEYIDSVRWTFVGACVSGQPDIHSFQPASRSSTASQVHTPCA
jgi:hypothetical protein